MPGDALGVQIDPRTIERAEERGANPQEIMDFLDCGFEVTADQRWLGKAKVFNFNGNVKASHTSIRGLKNSIFGDKAALSQWRPVFLADIPLRVVTTPG
jgi:hypothetical protein